MINAQCRWFVLFWVGLWGQDGSRGAVVPPMRPFHSSATPDGWVCNAGYFRTTGQPPTCKACSVRRTCASKGERFVACTPWVDARCEACPALPAGIVYARGCEVTVCEEGTFNATAAKRRCEVCPEDSYCTEGRRLRCPEGTTSLVSGASDALACVPPVNPTTTTSTNNNTSQIMALNVLWSTEAAIAGVCPNVAEVALRWLRFGLLLECQVAVANYSETIGGVQCMVMTARALATPYAQWLSANAQAQQTTWMQPFLRGCLGRSELRVTDVSVAAVLSGVMGTKDEGGVPTNRSLVAGPTLRYERRRWGTGQQDVTTFVIAASVLVVGMCGSIGLLVCGLLLLLMRP